MELKEQEKTGDKEVPKYRIKGRFNNKNNKNTEVHPQDKRERTRPKQAKGRRTNTEKTNEYELEDEDKLRLRRNRFSSDNKEFNSTKNQYGYVSRGEDNRLQKSHKERLNFFNHIVSSFIRYSNENTMSDLSRDFDKLIKRNEIPPESDDTGTLEIPTIDTILSNLRKLREALLHERATDFTKKVFLFSIRVAVNIGNYQTYIPSITYLLHSHNSLLLEDMEKQEIATILVLHTAHFNGENSKALQLYFKYVDTSEIKTLKILKSWINNDYYNWIQYYNSETDNGKAVVMKFGLPSMARHMVNCISKSYFSFKLKDFEDNYLPNGSSYSQLNDEYEANWKLENDTIVVRERKVR